MRHALSRRLNRIEAAAGDPRRARPDCATCRGRPVFLELVDGQPLPEVVRCEGCGGEREVHAWQYVDGMV